MVKKQEDTEKLIVEAARKVFTKKGLSGARMQEIADEAGINKSLLHYYFRNKEQLFEAIFKEVFPRFIPALFHILNEDNPFEDKIHQFVSHYIDEFAEKSYIPVFMINEIHQNPDRLKSLTAAISKIKDSIFIKQLNEGIKEGIYKPIEPIHLLSNIIALSIFPLIAKPIFTSVFGLKEENYFDFLMEKKTLIPELIISSLKPSEK